MGYLKEAAPIVGNAVLLPDRELQPHVVAEHGRYMFDRHMGALDAPEYIVSGGCHVGGGQLVKWSSQQMVSRDMLDAYEYTDRSARVTDCASDPMRGAA